jgi:hypothetical protein
MVHNDKMTGYQSAITFKKRRENLPGSSCLSFWKKEKKKGKKKAFFFPFFFFKDFVALYFYNTRNTRTMEIKEGGI